MPQSELYTAIDEIEKYIYSGFSVFGGYYIVKKTELYNKFKKVYNSLPQEILANRDYLKTYKEENIFSTLNKVDIMFKNSKIFLGFILINVKTVTNIIDEMYTVIPIDINICRKNN